MSRPKNGRTVLVAVGLDGTSLMHRTAKDGKAKLVTVLVFKFYAKNVTGAEKYDRLK